MNRSASMIAAAFVIALALAAMLVLCCALPYLTGVVR